MIYFQLITIYMFVLVLKYIKNKIVILITIRLPLTRFAGDKL